MCSEEQALERDEEVTAIRRSGSRVGVEVVSQVDQVWFGSASRGGC
jgi:hypothetical protein